MTLSLAQQDDLLGAVERALIDPGMSPDHVDGIRFGLEAAAKLLEQRAAERRFWPWFRPSHELRTIAVDLRLMRLP